MDSGRDDATSIGKPDGSTKRDDPFAGDDELWAEEDLVQLQARALDGSITDLSLALDRVERLVARLVGRARAAAAARDRAPEPRTRTPSSQRSLYVEVHALTALFRSDRGRYWSDLRTLIGHCGVDPGRMVAAGKRSGDGADVLLFVLPDESAVEIEYTNALPGDEGPASLNAWTPLDEAGPGWNLHRARIEVARTFVAR